MHARIAYSHNVIFLATCKDFKDSRLSMESSRRSDSLQDDKISRNATNHKISKEGPQHFSQNHALTTTPVQGRSEFARDRPQNVTERTSLPRHCSLVHKGFHLVSDGRAVDSTFMATTAARYIHTGSHRSGRVWSKLWEQRRTLSDQNYYLQPLTNPQTDLFWLNNVVKKTK